MAQAGRNAYGEEMRRRAVRILSEGAGHRSLARELDIPDATARQWARAFAAGGEDAVMNGGSHHRAYDFETKLAVARDRVERGKSVREVMIAHGVTSESSVKMWCRKYRDGGADALVEKRRGRRPASGERRDDI